MPEELLENLLLIAGLVQFAIILASLGLPKVLRWKQDLVQLHPLNRHIFYVYSAYILGTNLAIASLSSFAPHWLLEAQPLAFVILAYILVYWGVRVAIQLFAYRGECLPKGLRYRVADVAFTFAFVFLTLVYGLALEHVGGAL